MTEAAVAAVRALAEQAAKDAEMVVEDVTIAPVGRRQQVRVVVDLPEDHLESVSMDAVSQVSTRLSQLLDDDNPLGDTPFVLEVTSPGAERPLTQRRHWLRARQRTVHVTLADGTSRQGKLSDVSDTGIIVAGESLLWDQIAKARSVVDFGG